jgi:serine/threonine protein kinase
MGVIPGTRLGPYEILSPLGAGGMGEVYRARDTRLGREVAIKVLPASFSQDTDRLRRFEQEAKTAGSLNHPNITANVSLRLQLSCGPTGSTSRRIGSRPEQAFKPPSRAPARRGDFDRAGSEPPSRCGLGNAGSRPRVRSPRRYRPRSVAAASPSKPFVGFTRITRTLAG